MEVVLLLLRRSSLVGAGSSFSSWVASLKRRWCEGTKKKVEGDWIRSITEDTVLFTSRKSSTRRSKHTGQFHTIV